MTDLEARARELARTILPASGLYPEEIQVNRRARYMPDILAFARSVAADAREEALREAEAACDFTAPAGGGAHSHGMIQARERCLNAIRALLRAEPSPPSETVHFTKSHQRAMERKILPDPAPLESGELALERAHSILLAILSADERGQGQPFAEAMEAAAKEIGHAYF